MDMKKVNSLDFPEFVSVFRNVVERCPLVAAAVWSHRPFSGLEDLENHFFAFIDALPKSGQEGILRCHPDLAGHDMLMGRLSDESRREQSHAGLTSLKTHDRLRLLHLNHEYRKRFGFPFVVAALLSDRATVFQELARRMHCQPESELRTALDEVKKIIHLRLIDLLDSHYFGVEPPQGRGSERRQDASERGDPAPQASSDLEDDPHTHTKEVEN